MPLRLLIVEDEIVIARDLEEQLKSFGYNIVGIAKNGKIAIQKFSDLKPDMILMDILLKNSDFDGVELAKIFNNFAPPQPMVSYRGFQRSFWYQHPHQVWNIRRSFPVSWKSDQ